MKKADFFTSRAGVDAGREDFGNQRAAIDHGRVGTATALIGGGGDKIQLRLGGQANQAPAGVEGVAGDGFIEGDLVDEGAEVKDPQPEEIGMCPTLNWARLLDTKSKRRRKKREQRLGKTKEAMGAAWKVNELEVEMKV